MSESNRHESDDAPSSPSRKPDDDCKKSSYSLPLIVFVICFVAYQLNGIPLYGRDQESSMLLSVNLLKHHSFAITPYNAPNAFVWNLTEPDGRTKNIRIFFWNKALTDWYRMGRLEPTPFYYIVPTNHPGQYVSTFGMGSAITALPVYAILNLFTDIHTSHYWWWYGAKLTASLVTALCALLIYLSMRQFVADRSAFVGAIVFGLGTCAWSISSQALWQQTPYMFFLSLGAYFLFGIQKRAHFAYYCAMALGMATLCRPTGLIAVVCVGLYLLSRDRETLIRFTIGGIPFAIALAMYNSYYYGGPFTSGQEVVGKALSASKNEFEGIWQTPLLEGLTGILISPSRGLLVYSPVMIVAFIGAFMTWRSRERFGLLIPLQATVLITIILSSKFYDWWGGWSFGPRRIVDTSVFLTLSMIPVIDAIWSKRWKQTLFAIALAYSIAVQALGAWSYNGFGWNYKNGMNIDEKKHRDRLWSLTDSQIIYYVSHIGSARAAKVQLSTESLKKKDPILIDHPPWVSP